MASKRTEGKGKKKRFVVRYDERVNGRRKQKQRSFISSKEADTFMAALTLSEQREKELDPVITVEKKESNEKNQSSVSFRQFAENWFNVEYYSRVRPTTFKNGKYYLYNHILPVFGEVILEDIHAEDIKKFYSDKKRQGFAEKTISGLHKFLSTLFIGAVENSYLSSSPMNFKNKPKAPLKIGAPWTYSEMVQFLAWAEQVGKDVMYDFTLSTALREGEVLALPWFNLDLEKGEVTVTRSVSYDEKGNPELIPKTEKSYRTITLPWSLIQKLQEHKEKQMVMKIRFGEAYQHDLDLVFPTMNGGFLNPSNVRRELYRLMKEANVRKITFHDLRHTHASLLIKNGASPKLVQQRLGHKDVETTLRYYAHLYPNADKEAVSSYEQEIEKHRQKLIMKNKCESV